MRLISFLITVVFIIALIAFSVLNVADVVVNLYGQNVILPLCLLLAITFVLGALFAMIFSSISIMKAKLRK